MPELIRRLLGFVKINHIWLFLTERCNLQCDYCFFGDRDGRTTISSEVVRSLVDVLPEGKGYDVVISGGEPLLEWQLTKEVVRVFRSRDRRAGMLIQTNGLLLDNKKRAFIKNERIGLEFGIDGTLAANISHRKGIAAEKYKDMLGNIREAVSAGIRTCATMTVHPTEVERMLDNYRAVVALGVQTVEVHPAFMAPWTLPTARQFVKGYRYLVAQDLRQRRRIISPYYSRSIEPLMDLVLQPDGWVLPNWTYLVFPKRDRELFYVMRMTDKKVIGDCSADQLSEYLKLIRLFFAEPRTYRDFSNFNARRILSRIKHAQSTRVFNAYEEACRQAQQIDMRFLLPNKTNGVNDLVK